MSTLGWLLFFKSVGMNSPLLSCCCDFPWGLTFPQRLCMCVLNPACIHYILSLSFSTLVGFLPENLLKRLLGLQTPNHTITVSVVFMKVMKKNWMLSSSCIRWLLHLGYFVTFLCSYREYQDKQSKQTSNKHISKHRIWTCNRQNL